MKQSEAMALSLARQTVSQAEGFAFIAREKQDKDPVGSAVRLFAQGNEPKMIQIARYAGEFAARERHFFDFANRTLEFRKILMPETGDGLKVTVKLPWTGFLGARNPLENDVALGSVALLALLSSWLVTSALAGRHRKQARQTRARVVSWITVTRNILTELSIALREVIRSAQKIAKAASNSRSATGSLRDRIHASVTELHATRRALAEGEQTLAQAEAASLAAAMEAARLGPPATRLAQVTTEVHRKIQKLRKTMLESAAAVQKLEVGIEPCAADADEAFHAFEDLGAITQEMREHIKKSTETIQSQARMFDVLKGEFTEASGRRAAAQAPAPVPALVPSLGAPLPQSPSAAAPTTPAPASASAPRPSRKRAKKPAQPTAAA